MRFKRDGDLADSESSIFWGREALSAKRNIYAASQLIASLIASGVNRENLEIQMLEKEFPNATRPADRVAIESATDVIQDNFSVTEEDFEELEVLEEVDVKIEDEAAEDYFEDYFPELIDSLNDPRSPHLEP